MTDHRNDRQERLEFHMRTDEERFAQIRRETRRLVIWTNVLLVFAAINFGLALLFLAMR